MNDPDLSREQRLTSAQIVRLAGSGQGDVLVALIESGSLAVERIPNDDPSALLAAIDRADAPDDLLPRLASWPGTAVRLVLGEYASARPDIAQLVTDDEDCPVAVCAARLWSFPKSWHCGCRGVPRPASGSHWHRTCMRASFWTV